MEYSNFNKPITALLNDPAARYYKAHEGISKSDFLEVVASTGFNLTEFTKLLPVTRRTMEKSKDDDLLSPTVSDRVLQIAALFNHGGEVFGNLKSFKDWISTTSIALGGKCPIDFMDSDTGISLINDQLGRIAHGVYS